MNKLLSILPTVFTSITVFAGPSCDWKPIKTDTTQSNDYLLQVVTLDCNIDYYKNDNITAQKAVIRDNLGNIAADHIGNWGPGNEYYADEVSIATTPNGFPHQVILTSVYGGSNTSHTYHIYSTSPTLKKIGKVTQPLNKYQTTKGNGSEREVVGFYEDKGVFLIDRLTTEGTELGKCNACQSWNVETLKVVESRLASVGTRKFNINDFKGGELNQGDISKATSFFERFFDILGK